MSQVAHRLFYDFTSIKDDNKSSKEALTDIKNLFDYTNENILGNNNSFISPFGVKRIVYCDYTASGRSVRFIENYILEQVLPNYGSTHSTTSVTSLQTSLYRNEARDIIRNAVRASEHDRIIFTGSGATSAIHKLIHGVTPKYQNLVVFVDFTAHHSSILPWREVGATVIRINENSLGTIDVEQLNKLLVEYKNPRVQMIGCFSAASNVTGIIFDDILITKILHEHGALAFWDYASAAPYVDIQMNPILADDLDGHAHKDAIYFSLHKFIGGVQTPGVLVVKQHLFCNEVPSEAGGGTVFFVSREGHRYLKDIEEREEGGTPPIVETIRGGMVMQLKMNLTTSAIMNHCKELLNLIVNFVKTVPNLRILGNIINSNFSSNLINLPILSFLVFHPDSNCFLHPHFISAILNDVYGIQARSGCACAGPYAQDLLGIDEELARKYESLLIESEGLDRLHLRRREEHSKYEVLRPGFTRINIPFTANKEQVSYILSALTAVAAHGWKLLPQYLFNSDTGEWKHNTNLVFKKREWLQNISYENGVFESNLKGAHSEEIPSYQTCLENGERIFKESIKVAQRAVIANESSFFTGEAHVLRWFLLPSEAKSFLLGNFACKLEKLPFEPIVYPLSEGLLTSRKLYVWSSIKLDIPFGSVYSVNSPKLNHCGSITVDTTLENSIKDDKKLSSFSETNKNISDTVACTMMKKLDIYESSSKCDVNDHGDSKIYNRNDDSISCSDNENRMLDSVGTPKKCLWKIPPKVVFGPTVEALEKFAMISDQDRVLVCLSGGKDSLSLLHTLRQIKFYLGSKGIHFSIGAATVDPQSTAYDPKPLIPYINSLGIPYFYEEQGILPQAQAMTDLNSICSFCSRLKRGRLYACARREGYNVLALGQHLDDMTESFLMSCLHNGRLRTMKAAYTVKEGDLRIIRPFTFVREKDLRQFAETNKLPIIPENCPGCFEAPKERHRMKQLLAQQELIFPKLFWSLKTAMLPLLSINKTGLENSLFGKNSRFAEGDSDVE